VVQSGPQQGASDTGEVLDAWPTTCTVSRRPRASVTMVRSRPSSSELLYSAVESDLEPLLTEYGPANKTMHAYPFHHLVSDGV
jgi:hypothetical protein